MPSKENVVADSASRINNIDTEWEVAPWAFRQISNLFGQPQIDLFASVNNEKCSDYCSWHRDPEAFCIDTFTVKWDTFYFYAFPPFSLILKTLRKI
ncbi:GSCOCG00012209001-RA-CDS, partial [Cotesia congregata]